MLRFKVAATSCLQAVHRIKVSSAPAFFRAAPPLTMPSCFANGNQGNPVMRCHTGDSNQMTSVHGPSGHLWRRHPVLIMVHKEDVV